MPGFEGGQGKAQEARATFIGWLLTRRPIAAVIRKLASRGVLDGVAALFMIVSVLAVALYGLVKPAYNWDMVAYVASALENRYPDPVDLHRETWALVDAGASAQQQFDLKQSNPYNLHQWQNPADFQSQLSMYRVKIGYIALMRALEPLTGLVNASILLSVLPGLFFGLFCLWWLWRAGALQAAYVLTPVLFIASYWRMTSAATPDLLAVLLSFAALYSLWRGRDWIGGTLLFASVFMRPDNLILVFALLIAAVLFNWRWLPMAVTFAASLVATLVFSKLGGHPGWWAHFYFSCVQIQNSMAGFHPDFTLIAFLRGYLRGAVVALQDNVWPGLLLVMTVCWATLRRHGLMREGRANALVFALAIGTLGKFASFPLPDDRFYFVFIAGMAMMLCLAWKPRLDLN